MLTGYDYDRNGLPAFNYVQQVGNYALGQS